MNEKQLKILLENPKIVDERIKDYLAKQLLFRQDVDKAEIYGHIAKAEHNSNFIQDAVMQKYVDWAVVGCYYANYHIALALLMKKGFSSKNHDATLCVLIKHYFKKGLTGQDIELINKIYLDNNDILFYVESKQEREKASYSTKIVFDKQLVSQLQFKTLLFVNKGKEIIKNN